MLEMLSTPGAMAVAIVWLHFRLKRIEEMHVTLATAFGVHLPYRKKKINGTLLALAGLCLCAALAFAGCAGVSVATKTVETTTNGVTTARTSTARSFTVWDASSSVGKLKVGNGKTQSIGASDVNETSTSTNAVNVLKGLTDLVNSLPK